MTDRLALASLIGLPGLPASDRDLRREATAAGWPIAGGCVAVADLPAETRAALAARQTPAIGTNGARGVVPLSETAERRAAARAAIVQAWREFCRQAMLSPSAGAEIFPTLYMRGQIAAEPWVRDEVDHICSRSLLSWARASAREGFVALAGRYGNRKATGAFDTDPDIRDLAVGMLAASPHVDAAQIDRALHARFPDRDLPSSPTVRRFVARFRADHPSVLLSLANPDAYRSRRRAAFGSQSEGVDGLNALWEIDSTPVDLTTSDGRRQALIACIDVWSRRLQVIVAPASSGLAITCAIRQAILAWGVPGRAKTDNGKDYVSNHVRRAMVDLSIEHQLCPPYTPEGKPHVERVIGTLLHQFVELLPGYTGHCVADQQAIRSRRSFAQQREQEAPIEVRLTAAELQERLDAWCEHVYGRQRHRSLGRSPFEVAASWTGPVRRVADERALDVLLAPAADNDGVRRVGKKGIAVEGTHFIAPELGPLVGEDIRVRLDPADMGRIWVFAMDGAFVCNAVSPRRMGVDRAAVAAEAKARQAAAVAAARKELKAVARRVKAADVADDILAAGRAKAAQVVALPRRGDEHATPAIEQAGRAARSNDTPMSAPLTEAGRRAQARAEARVQAALPLSDVDRARRNWDRADGIEGRLHRGEAVSDADAQWFRLYAQSKEWRAHQRLRRVALAG